MSAAQHAHGTSLTAGDPARVAALVAEILAAGAPGEALGKVAETQPPAVAAAVFEAVCYRVDTQDDRLQHAMWTVYQALGPERDDAVFSHAANAVQMHPDDDRSPHLVRSMVQILCRRGRSRAALALLEHHARRSPALRQHLGLPPEAAADGCGDREAGLGPLPPEDEAGLGPFVETVLASAAPQETLNDILHDLELAQQPALAAALFESVCHRVPGHAFWLHYRMWKVYRALGAARDDAAFFHAAAAVQMHPDSSGADQAFRDLFLMFLRRGRERDALDLFRHGAPWHPTRPAASPPEIDPIVARLEPAARPARNPAAGGVRLHAVQPAEVRPPWACPVLGGELHMALRHLTRPLPRPAITVAEFAEAEVLVYRDSAVVVDSTGAVQDVWSVAEYPEQIRAALLRAEREGETVERHETEAAVLLSDPYPAPNLAHYLLDQITRLDLYRRLEIDTGAALVIGPEPVMAAQQQIFRLAGVGHYLGTDRVARVRARRLWVSSNCRDLQHAAHLGADWAVQFAQATLRGQGSRGWRRLYVSRNDARGRRVANEAEVMALLEPLGFELVVPGRMPYQAQVAAFKQASDVIGPHGAGLAHVVLCPPGARVLEIFHPLYGTSTYAMQQSAAGFRYTAFMARDWASDEPAWNDPAQAGPRGFLTERHMRVDLDLLSRYLETVV